MMNAGHRKQETGVRGPVIKKKEHAKSDKRGTGGK